MKSLSKQGNKEFTKSLCTDLGIILLASFGIAIGLVILGMIGWYEHKY